MLWAPFLLGAHAAVLIARAVGMQVSADGFSLPYLFAMAIGTLLYGFLALLLSYRVACQLCCGALGAVCDHRHLVGQLASGLHVFQSLVVARAFRVLCRAVFLVLAAHSENFAGPGNGSVLGLIAGLMLNVYYPNALVLAVLIPEALAQTGHPIQNDGSRNSASDSQGLALCWPASGVRRNHVRLAAADVPDQILRVRRIFRDRLYVRITQWAWSSPWFLELLFSSNHGLFSWTPLLLIAVVGICSFLREKFRVSALLSYACCLPSTTSWPPIRIGPGISSYGNRFFVSLTIFFVLGLAVAVGENRGVLPEPDCGFRWLAGTLGVFVLWNLGLIFQWGSHLIPARGEVSWKQVAPQSVPRCSEANRVAAGILSFPAKRVVAHHRRARYRAATQRFIPLIVRITYQGSPRPPISDNIKDSPGFEL